MTTDTYTDLDVEPPKKKKKGVNGKAKGNSYERKICKELSKLLTLGEEEYAVWRSASSGAVATNLHKKTRTKESFLKSNSGDITQVIPQGEYKKLDEFFSKYFVETKHYKTFNLTPPFTKDIKEIFKQLKGEKEVSGKDIIFIFKANNREELLITNIELLDNRHLKMILFIDENNPMYVYLYKDFILNY
jgi:hypothetical protein